MAKDLLLIILTPRTQSRNFNRPMPAKFSYQVFIFRLLVLLISTVDSNVKVFLDANNELANLYEMSAQYYSLTESGENRYHSYIT